MKKYMNKKAAGTNITWTIIALSAFITMISLSILAYDQFDDAMGVGVIDPYSNSTNQSLTTLQNEQDNLDSLKTGITGSVFSISFATSVASGIVTTAIIGIQSIATLTKLPGYVNNVLTDISVGAKFGDAGVILISFLMFGATILIFMKVIKAIRGTIDEA